MKHGVVGAGGIGGLMTAALARAGLPVVVVRRPGSEPVDRLRIRSQVLGEFEAHVESSERLEEAVDVLWIAVKANALEAALAEAPPEMVRLAVVPLLNGVDHMAPLRARYGAEKVVAGTIRVEAEKVADGEIVQNGPFIAVDLAGAGAERIAEDVERTGIRVTVQEDADLALWSKLIMLGPFALASTASGLNLGGIAHDPRWRDLMLGVMHEVREVAAAQGIELTEPVQMLEVAPPDMRTSMQKDAAAGRPLELDHIAGPILRGGREHRIPTPATEELAGLIRERHPG